ncbi:MAG: CHC2 zinc finger domain-containing protein [Novosphingobium sp.]
MLDIPAIRAAHPLPAIAGASVRLQRAGAEWKGCCPFHADRSPSFTIFAGGERFHCFGCGASGDVLDFVARLHGFGLIDAARALGAGDLPQADLPVLAPSLAPAAKGDRTSEALAIWQRAIPAAGTLAEAYLASRGISPPFPPDIRFQRLPCGNSGLLPCLVAAVRDVAGDLSGIQRIFLRSDGRGKADLPKPKLSLGKVAGGAIRLGDLDSSGMVTVCEGPEDGLSLRAMLGGPVWVAAGAAMLPAMQFPADVRAIIIGADNDAAGEEAANKAAHAFALRGLTVRIIRPLAGFKDFNEEKRGGSGHAA